MSRSFSVSLRVLPLLLLIGVALCSPGIPTVLAKGKPGTFKLLGSHKLGPPRSHQLHTLSAAIGACAPKDCGTPPLSWKGGPEVHDPQMYLVFWGSWWNSSAEASSGIVPAMQSLFGHLAGGQYNNILSQYHDNVGAPNDFVHNDVTWVRSVTDAGTSPSASLTMTGIGQEVLNVMAANQVPYSANTMVMVFPQPGTTYDSSFNTSPVTCGEHAYGTGFGGVVFGMVRYVHDQSLCNPGSIVGDMQTIAAHEYAEMATDPETGVYSAWVTNDGFEIGDLCQDYGAQSYPPKNYGTPLSVPLLWSNNSNGCVLAEGQEYPSPVSPGQHTVQGLILDKYQALGGPSSLLGEPNTEESPISGGAVSYFAGNGNLVCNYYGPSGSSGAIYYGPGIGIYEVHGCIFDLYQAFSGPGGLLGFPARDVQAIAGGDVSYFAGQVCNGGYTPPEGEGGASGSAIYWSANTGVHEVHGCIYHQYISVGGPTGRLGFPVSNEYTNAAGNRESDFQGGNIQFVNGIAVVNVALSCTNPTAVYALHTDGNLFWFGNTDPAGGSLSWANGGNGKVVGSGWFPSGGFSGGNGVIYSIHSDGTLWWFKHLGAADGSVSWANGGYGKQIGSGWSFEYVFSGGNGVIYAVDNSGYLHWYRHLGYTDGSWSWAAGSGNIVGSGWGYSSTGTSYVFSGGGGIIYAVHTDGTLYWFDHLGYLDGSTTWANGGMGKVIGSGWSGVNGTLGSFSAGGGIIFTIHADGTLYWFDHLGYLDGSATWANGGYGKVIGSGWDTAFGPFADVNACK